MALKRPTKICDESARVDQSAVLLSLTCATLWVMEEVLPVGHRLGERVAVNIGEIQVVVAQ